MEMLQKQLEEATAQRQKELEKQAKKLLLTKQKLTDSITKYGLWQTSEEVEIETQKLTSERKKREALKIQLRFRKTVLLQTSTDPNVFNFFKRGIGVFNSTQLKENLLKLVESANECIENDPTLSHASIRINHSIDNCELTGSSIVFRK